MLNFLKKLLLSNKYSLLVLLILSLWLKLVKDYNIILSYLVLIVLYLLVGILVEMVLEKFFPNFNNPHREEQSAPAQNYEDPDKEKEEPAENLPVRGIPERRYTARTAAVRRETVRPEAPERRRPADPSGIQEHAQKLEESEITPKVTSSYIKNAGSIPRDMEKKLVRTAANFQSIKQNSDRLNPAAGTTRRAYGSTKNPFVEKEEDLYTNKKVPPAVSSDKKETDPAVPETAQTLPEQPAEPVKSRPSVRNIEYEPMEDYKTATPDELGKISDDISREVERRVAAPRSVRRTRVMLPDDLSDSESEPVKPRRQELYSSARNDSSFREEPAERPEDRNKETAEDKVSADMEKIDRLFNRNRGTTDGDEEQNKTGVWNRFKKKR